MRKIRLLLFLVAFMPLCFACSTNEPVNHNSKSTGKLFIIGGGHRSDSLMQRMFDEAKLTDDGYVIILPMSSEEPDSAIYYAKTQFDRLGIESVVGFNFSSDSDDNNDDKIDSLKRASVIYISGGNQNRFMEIVEDTEIEKAIHSAYENGAMIGGTSAGAAVMSEIMITGDEKRYPEYRPTSRVIESDNIEIKKGLGLLKNAIVDQHFIWRSRYNRLLSLIVEHPDLIGVGIDESTALLVKGNHAEVLGKSQVIVFKNKDKQKSEKSEKLGAKNIILDIYLPGEKFIIE